MIKSEPSVAEIEINEAIKEMNFLTNTTLITIADAKTLIGAGYKVLLKCEELRKSRDRWHEKYDEIKNKERGDLPLK